MNRPHLALACAAAALLAAGSIGAKAERRTVTTTYGVSILGLPVGKASFDTVIDGERFSVKGTLSSSGIGGLVTDTSGGSSVSGRIGGDRLYPDRYGLEYSSDEKTWSSDVAFESGGVASAEVSPKRARQKPDFVPVTESQLASAVDPLSGLMIKAKSAGEVCNRTLPFYDGWSRLDLELSPAGRETYSMDGFTGEAAVCDVAIRPVGGFRTSSKGLNYLKDRTISLWFAPIAVEDIFVPVYASIPTRIGSVTLEATSVASN